MINFIKLSSYINLWSNLWSSIILFNFVKRYEFMVYNYVNFINIFYDKELLE